MGLCGHAGMCDCAIRGVGINVAGSGRMGDPYVLTALGLAVCTSGTRPTPVQGLKIYETDTLRELTYDGTNWVIAGGQWPGASLARSTTLSHATSGAWQDATLPTEIYDYGSFHASSDAFVTVPTGLGGDYDVNALVAFAQNSTGIRGCKLVIANNTVPTAAGEAAECIDIVNTNVTTEARARVNELLRLEAGATVTLQGYQISGGALNITAARLSLVMRRHLPALT